MEITINVKVTGLDRLAAAIESLVSVQNGVPANTPATQTANPAPVNLSVVQPIQQPVQAQTIQPIQAQPVAAPVAPAVQMVPAAPMTQGATALAQNPIPTAAPTYTHDQLAVAATQLMDAGRQQELVVLLNSFGVQALTMLPKERYGEFATRLRAMGAKI